MAAQTIEWKTARAPVAYEPAISFMEQRVAEIRAGTKPEMVWLLEHPHVYTAGTSAQPADLLDSGNIPVIATGRGGQYTYHGPGQRIGYVMLDLARRGNDIRDYVRRLETWLIATIAVFGLEGRRHPDRIGIWVETPTAGEAKIAALGVRVRKWVSYHGVSINVHPELQHYQGIVPCGIRDYGVTSFADLGLNVTITELDAALRTTFIDAFEG